METSTGTTKTYKPRTKTIATGESVLDEVKSTNPEHDTRILWDISIRRITDATREDEVNPAEGLIGLGVSVAARASVMSKNPVGGEDSKAMLAELFAGEVEHPEHVGARINSLYAYRDFYAQTGKQVNIFLLNKVLNGLDGEHAPLDYSLKGQFEPALAHVQTVLNIFEKRNEFEGKPLVEDTGSALVLNPAIQSMLEATPDRYAAIIDLIANRRLESTSAVLDMLNVSDANSMMDGAL